MLLAFRAVDPLGAVCSQRSRLRVSTGSPVASALSVYCFNPTFDMFTGIVKGVQASLIATAARATGGGFFAFAVEPEIVDGRPEFVDDCKLRLPALGDDYFVKPGADVFLNATAISHCPVLTGVRFDERDGNVVTHTLSLRSLTRSQRRLRHLHNQAQRREFHLFEESTGASTRRSYQELVDYIQTLC
jgi:fructose-1,6-bisphosphatase/sedoheptulose 1,7-bisphosphatase-like protein